MVLEISLFPHTFEQTPFLPRSSRARLDPVCFELHASFCLGQLQSIEPGLLSCLFYFVPGISSVNLFSLKR